MENNYINISDIFKVLLQAKYKIIVPSFLIGVVVAFYTSSLPNIYQSKVTLAPNNSINDGQNTQAFGGLGGLAEFAGVKLGASKVDKIDLALAILQSKQFIINFSTTYLDVEKLIAAKEWDRASNQIIIDEQYYDSNEKKWVRSPLNSNDMSPNRIDIYKYFTRKVISIEQDNSTGIIEIEARHLSPYFAKEMLDKLVLAINEEIKSKDILDAQEGIEFYSMQIEKTQDISIRNLIYELMSKNMRTIMLANTKMEYIFTTIDPALVDDTKVAPKRVYAIVLAMFATFTFMSLGVLFFKFSKN